MTATVPPSPRRLRAARRAGLRPRSPAAALAGLAIGAWALIGALERAVPAWMHHALARALRAERPIPDLDPTRAAALLLGMAVILGAATLLLVGRLRARRRLGVDPALGEIPPWLSMLSCVLALTILATWLRPALATAARSVDVVGPAGLWIVWTRWLGAGLLGLALVAAAVAVIERLVSARRLWHGLHLTRAQARDQARAAGDPRRR